MFEEKQAFMEDLKPEETKQPEEQVLVKTPERQPLVPSKSLSNDSAVPIKKPRTESQKAATRLMMERRRESIAMKKDVKPVFDKQANKRKMIEDVVDSRFDYFEDRILHLLTEPFEKYNTRQSSEKPDDKKESKAESKPETKRQNDFSRFF